MKVTGADTRDDGEEQCPASFEVCGRMARELKHADLETGSEIIVNIKVDSSLSSQHGSGETDAVDSHMDDGEWRMARSVAISRVRAQLSGADDDGIYAPHCVPIGPYHLSRSSPAIEKEKTRCVSLLQSLSAEPLMDLMEKLEPLARQSYADGVGDMTPEQLSSMLLSDGCYLLQFFVGYDAPGSRAPTARIDEQRPAAPPAAAVSRNTFVRDTVFLLENQIPLLVLQRLHERVTGGTSSSALHHIAVAAPVQELLQKMLFISMKPRPPPPPPTCSHLLHLVHAYLQPAAAGTSTASRRPTGRWRRALEYRRYANVGFKPRKLADDEVSSVLDVRLQGGTLSIPRLRVDGNTWTILRNLMALEEQAAHLRRRPVTAYCVFMSQVACTAEDVGILRRAGVVDHFLRNDKQVAQGFAGLFAGGVAMEADDTIGYLTPMWHELEERCSAPLHNFMGFFLHKYGDNLFDRLVFSVALILFVLEAMQVVYAALAYHKPKAH
ncbi:unnamed protein product [Urochloa decumbens]|uniref:Uncharacterized protein n=1 Tax=Urochloa decumbens TaxID=240449 RepID=A0ABC9GBX2_9POAL